MCYQKEYQRQKIKKNIFLMTKKPDQAQNMKIKGNSIAEIQSRVICQDFIMFIPFKLLNFQKKKSQHFNQFFSLQINKNYGESREKHSIPTILFHLQQKKTKVTKIKKLTNYANFSFQKATNHRFEVNSIVKASFGGINYKKFRQNGYLYNILQETKMFDLDQASYLVQKRAEQPSSLQNRHQTIDCSNNLYRQASKIPLDRAQTLGVKNSGKWTLRENMRYYLFLVQFKYLFKSKSLRKSERVFSLMAKHIHTRKTSQCKSHHQKIQKFFGSIENIIENCRKIYTPLAPEWKQFKNTEKRVLLNQFPQINSKQNYYQILQFRDSIKIYIDENLIQTYEI